MHVVLKQAKQPTPYESHDDLKDNSIVLPWMLALVGYVVV